MAWTLFRDICSVIRAHVWGKDDDLLSTANNDDSLSPAEKDLIHALAELKWNEHFFAEEIKKRRLTDKRLRLVIGELKEISLEFRSLRNLARKFGEESEVMVEDEDDKEEEEGGQGTMLEVCDDRGSDVEPLVKVEPESRRADINGDEGWVSDI